TIPLADSLGLVNFLRDSGKAMFPPRSGRSLSLSHIRCRPSWSISFRPCTQDRMLPSDFPEQLAIPAPCVCNYLAAEMLAWAIVRVYEGGLCGRGGEQIMEGHTFLLEVDGPARQLGQEVR